MKVLDRVSKKIGKDVEILTSLNCEMQMNKDARSNHKGMLLATDKGLFFYDTEEMRFNGIEGLDYSNIEDLKYNKGLVKSNIFLNYDKKPVKFFNIIPGDENELVNIVSSKITI